ncbi:hypothetical protein EDC01DRAFT_780726 [Geopyxis carbonaria]|nr:hypothetical protein EDC01DRAFT_780726 [Geopyxis carbonaria]
MDGWMDCCCDCTASPPRAGETLHRERDVWCLGGGGVTPPRPPRPRRPKNPRCTRAIAISHLRAVPLRGIFAPAPTPAPADAPGASSSWTRRRASERGRPRQAAVGRATDRYRYGRRVTGLTRRRADWPERASGARQSRTAARRDPQGWRALIGCGRCGRGIEIGGGVPRRNDDVRRDRGHRAERTAALVGALRHVQNSPVVGASEIPRLCLIASYSRAMQHRFHCDSCEPISTSLPPARTHAPFFSAATPAAPHPPSIRPASALRSQPPQVATPTYRHRPPPTADRRRREPEVYDDARHGHARPGAKLRAKSLYAGRFGSRGLVGEVWDPRRELPGETETYAPPPAAAATATPTGPEITGQGRIHAWAAQANERLPSLRAPGTIQANAPYLKVQHRERDAWTGPLGRREARGAAGCSPPCSAADLSLRIWSGRDPAPRRPGPVCRHQTAGRRWGSAWLRGETEGLDIGHPATAPVLQAMFAVSRAYDDDASRRRRELVVLVSCVVCRPAGVGTAWCVYVSLAAAGSSPQRSAEPGMQRQSAGGKPGLAQRGPAETRAATLQGVGGDGAIAFAAVVITAAAEELVLANSGGRRGQRLHVAIPTPAPG